MYCSYGCGKIGKYKFKNGKLCCSNSQNKCETKRKIGEKNKGNKRLDLLQYNKKHKKTKSNNPNWKGGYYTNDIPFYDTYSLQISFCESVRKNQNDINILEVKCAYCGKWYIPKLTDVCGRIQALNGRITTGTEHVYIVLRNVRKSAQFIIKSNGLKVSNQLHQEKFNQNSDKCILTVMISHVKNVANIKMI